MNTYAGSKKGLIFCRVLATLNRTFGTVSFDIEITIGNINFVVISGPQTSANTFKQNVTKM